MLFQRRFRPVIGLDITTSSIKLIELSKSGDSYRVESYAAEPSPPNAINEKAIVDAQAVGEAVRRAVKRAGARSKECAVAVSGDAAITKVIQMPRNLRENELESQVEMQADQYIPFPMEEVSYDFEVIGPSEKDPEMLDVRLGAADELSQDAAIRAFNEFLYDELGFTGNRDHYDDPRNSFLNEVLDRRTGIPITLAVIYLEVARRAGLRVDGINFPGHFLLRARDLTRADAATDAVIIDPFHGGALLSESDCRQLLRQHVGDDAAFDRTLLAPATRHDIIVRMLVNLKRLYVRMRSFPQARFISSLLLAVDPSAISELRDRGLLAYHLQDFAAALHDLEEYLRLIPKCASPGEPDLMASSEADDENGAEGTGDDTTQIWEHVKALRKRVASFN